MAVITQWAALILTGIVVGTVAARWNSAHHRDQQDRLDRQIDAVLLTAAAACVVAWFANAGSLIGSSSANSLLAAHVPIATAPGFRLAVLWATIPGASLTLGTVLLVWSAVGRVPRAASRIRYVAAIATIVLVALGVSLWFATAPPNEAPRHIPAFVQSAPAAVAPLLALAAIVLLVEVIAVRAAGGAPSHPRLLAAWFLATLAISAEQLARSRLGIGPRDAVIPGGASAGLILWLVASALLHRRVQSTVFGVTRSRATGLGRAAILAHVGAVLLAVSFAAHALAIRRTVSIPPGASVDLADTFRRTWHVANQGVSRFDVGDADVLGVALEVKSPSGGTTLVAPEVHELHGPRGEHLENTIARRKSAGNALMTVRALLVAADSLDVASLRITFLPFPVLWPVGVVLLSLSLLLARIPPESTPSSE
jgi:hypothetical protein